MAIKKLLLVTFLAGVLLGYGAQGVNANTVEAETSIELIAGFSDDESASDRSENTDSAKKSSQPADINKSSVKAESKNEVLINYEFSKKIATGGAKVAVDEEADVVLATEAREKFDELVDSIEGFFKKVNEYLRENVEIYSETTLVVK